MNSFLPALLAGTLALNVLWAVLLLVGHFQSHSASDIGAWRTREALSHPLSVCIGLSTLFFAVRSLNHPAACLLIVLSGALALAVMLAIYHQKLIWTALTWICANLFVLLSVSALGNSH